MSMNAHEVARIAELVRLELTDAEKGQYSEQLSDILQFVAVLKEVDTTDVAPTSHGLSQHNVMREDEVKDSLPLDKVFLNAPDHEEGQFRVPAVLE